MITDSYITNLIDIIPINIKKKYFDIPLQLDIVFEGGLFNGSYLAGCLLYLKQLESREYIQIHQISGCSIGSLLAILYFIPDPQLWIEIYQLASAHFKENHNINIFEDLFKIIKLHLPKNIISKINNRVYICYFNIKTGKRIIKKKYKNIDHLLEIVRRSCSFPYVVDNDLFYKNKFIDGLYPYIFKNASNRRILYLNIHNLNQISGMLSIKNEPTNIHRILEGIVDIHSFFISSSNTNICSFIDTWSIINKIKHFIFTFVITCVIFCMHKMYVLNQIVNNSLDTGKLNIYKLIKNIYIILLDKYCI